MILHPLDNVEVNLADGHKYARRDIAAGENVVKYGSPIGHATREIRAGEHVHTHNLATNLTGTLRYEYAPDLTPLAHVEDARTFEGYERPDGRAGVRNEIWIVCTVGCVAKTARVIAARTGAFALEHPYGCSQLGGDHKTTQLILRGLVRHPNAGGVLVLGLGCENNNIPAFCEVLGEVDPARVKFLNCQDSGDEVEEGVRLVAQLQRYAAGFSRRPLPLSRLCVGLKCGGSDGYSGITANPLVGAFSDGLIARGGACVLTEVPEMFGAEHLLMKRCPTRELFDKTVALVNGFKEYFTRHGQVVYENPSPGNKAGGITTLEEKSLGCIEKGGHAEIADVIGYGDTVTKNGLTLLDGPGNDIVAVTNLAAAGAAIILFTTGRGTPLGGVVPTVKISSNGALAARKPNWIDFDASPLLRGVPMRELASSLTELTVRVASGEETANERNGCRDLSIFKDGIIL